jgi:hypothetical protein
MNFQDKLVCKLALAHGVPLCCLPVEVTHLMFPNLVDNVTSSFLTIIACSLYGECGANVCFILRKID